MRLIPPALALAVSSAALIYSGNTLINQTFSTTEPPFAPPKPSARPSDTPVTVPADWPPLFGTQSAPPPPLDIVKAPDPDGPLIRSDLRLTGLVTGFGPTWAFLAGSDGPQLVRPGDRLDTGERVLRIDSTGVWLDDRGSAQIVPVAPAPSSTNTASEESPASGRTAHTDTTGRRLLNAP